ncbi:winged helix-turn-helix transcriptional regulator [Candidatus Bathyarchaeota archaeon]|nr:winged helix-turn-helix transcriptional regulator [Candidatus Bathyarchaeota archaeon]MBS7627670.1 winged helix-turn-helix transcriptional regulator [Candidatus Bathyarchaeota archaeon]
MQDFLLIRDPKVAKLLADETRREILHNLRHREMSPFQLAQALGKSVSSISYHLNALEEAGLVVKTRTLVKKNLIEKFYRSTAKVFVVSYTLSEGLIPGSEEYAQWTREVCRRAVENLPSFGYKLTKELEAELTDLFEKHFIQEQRAYEEVIAQQISPVQVEHSSLRLLLRLLSTVSLVKRKEYLDLLDEISKRLLREPPKPEGSS